MSERMNDNPKFVSMRDLFRTKIKSSTPIEEVIPQIPSFISGIEITNNVYIDLPRFCSSVFIECLPKIEALNLSEMRAVTYGLCAILNWGIYPHLPKSIQIPFMDKNHWIYSPAPPRMFKPEDAFLEALEIFFASISCASLHPLFLQHCISVLHFLDKDRLTRIIQGQDTTTLFSSIIALLPMKINVNYLLTQVVLNRSDALEAIEDTVFPPPMLAKAIGTPPDLNNQDDYYKKLFPRLFEATRSGKGDVLSKEIINFIVKTRPEQFLKNCDLTPLLEWPSKDSIGNIIWLLESVMLIQIASRVLVDPIPFRLLFIAALTEGEIHQKALKLAGYSVANVQGAINVFKILTSDSNLSALDLDLYGIEQRDNGIFVIEKEHDAEEQIAILTKMRELSASLFKTEFIPQIVDELPGTFGAIQLVSLVLPRCKTIQKEWATPLLSFLAKVQGDPEIGVDILEIAKTVFYGIDGIEELPSKVINTFGGDIPEMLSIKTSDAKESNNEDSFSMDSIIEDLKSPIPALRARGLFMLRRGVMDKTSPLRDEENIKKLFPSIETQLKHEESYVFINAIQTLETIGDVFPHLVVEKLAEQFPKKDVALSLKVSQALMLLSRRCGPGMVNSKSGNLCGFYIKAYARGVAHESTLIQASSLSDLAEFVQSIQFGCTPWLTDIVITIDNAWQAHHVVDVRRAASYLCYTLILVLGTGFGECSPEDVKYLGNIVKKNRLAELDDVAHQNAEDCYQTMWDVAAQYL